MLAFKYRFHGYGSLQYVYRKGLVFRTQTITLKYVKNKHRDNQRFSVVVSKKVMKSAVSRNRIRRRVYEYIRCNLNKLTTNVDVVIIITSGEVLSMEHKDLTTQLNDLFKKAGLYKDN